MKSSLLFTAILLFYSAMLNAQQINVEVITEINASGGVTMGPDGHVYISDFGPGLGFYNGNPTNVYKWVGSDSIEVFASGFRGASGACFDQNGNFYQSNPFGHNISKITPDGNVDHKWSTEGLLTPVGLAADSEGNIFVSNCGKNEIGKIDPDGNYTTYATSNLFNCPNGLTKDPEGNLFACNFGNGNVLRIDTNGFVSVIAKLPELVGGPKLVGNGHLIYSNGWLFVTTIGTGEIFRVGLGGGTTKVAGLSYAFLNQGGDVTSAAFNKPNGITATITGDTLYVNVSDPIWPTDPAGLHPARLMRITGVCSMEGSNCD